MMIIVLDSQRFNSAAIPDMTNHDFTLWGKPKDRVYYDSPGTFFAPACCPYDTFLSFNFVIFNSS